MSQASAWSPTAGGVLVTHLLITAIAAISQEPGTRVPTLILDAPPALAAVATEIRRFDPDRLTSVMRLTGLRDPGPPIRVVLRSEASEPARLTPSWVAGYAVSRRHLVVLFPERIGRYPYGSLESVLFHEVAHVLTHRAAGGRPVPRWFNEGLASAAERSWRLEDRSRLAWQLVTGGPLTATGLESLFARDQRAVARAYVLSDALVRDLLERHGAALAARVFARMREGDSFDRALWLVTGSTVGETVNGFWRRHAVWERWIAMLGHPFTVWSVITGLALIAIWRHRRRRRERRLRWELEEAAEAEAWAEHRRKYRVH